MNPRRERPAGGSAERVASALGRRLRSVRLSLGMTLKDVQAASGFSATHVSEIERGRTSPTVGALLRIAAALGKEPGYFVDEESGRRAAWMRGVAQPGGVDDAERVALGPPGGLDRLTAHRLRVPPGGRRSLGSSGELAGYVLEGRVRLIVGEGYWDLGAGDAFHVAPDARPSVENRAETPVHVLLFARQGSGA